MKAILFVLVMTPIAILAQKKATCTIYLPQTINKTQLDIYYYNGKERKRVGVQSGGDSIIVRDIYYASRLVLFISYSGSTPLKSRSTVFYVDDRPATIRLMGADSPQNVFSNMQVKNAVHARSMGFNQMHRYISAEHNRVYAAYSKAVASPADNTFKDTVAMLVNIELTKKMNYIRKNGHQYYSLFTFSTEYINSHLFPVDSLISIFNRSFPAEFKNSFEGKQTLSLLKIRKLREQQQLAPDFSATDIEGKPISLSQYKGKYVLINFWASWCVPCVKEFPALNELTANIPEDKLIRIFITEDQDTTAFDNARKKHHLTGRHLYANTELITTYNATAIPQLYLIDKEGKILYDRESLKDYELTMLAEVIKKAPGLQ